MGSREMETVKSSSCENNLKQVLKSDDRKPTNFRNNFHSVRILEHLLSLLKNEVLCDVRFKADDGKIVIGHKNVLIAASPYFRAMFSNFDESHKDLVNIRELDSTILQLLIDYIYTGEIMVTKENVQILLPAANILQLDFVSDACVKFLIKQLDASNCLGIRAFADLHNCTELLSSCEVYIKKYFLEVVKCDGFLSLSSEDVLKLISCNDLEVPFEEKVFQCVIKWIKHDLDQRKDILEELMEHVRLPLLKPNMLFNIMEEPLLNNSLKCKNYINEALCFNLQKSVQPFAIPKTIRCKPRQFSGSQKVILLYNWSHTLNKCSTEWYNPSTKLQKIGPKIDGCRKEVGLGVIRDQFVFVLGGVNQLSSKSVSMLDVSSLSPSWCPIVDMLVSRKKLGVGVLNDCIYAVGGLDGTNALNSVEVFDVIIQKWQMVSSMSIPRFDMGVCVLNNHLYAIGGRNTNGLKSVEYYDPTLDTWTSISEMSICREGVGVGVLDGVIYAIGGSNGMSNKSVEVYRPSDGVWSSIADMHFSRFRPGVVVLNGLLYVIGGNIVKEQNVEIYNPNNNTWTIQTFSGNVQVLGGVVVDKPL